MKSRVNKKSSTSVHGGVVVVDTKETDLLMGGCAQRGGEEVGSRILPAVFTSSSARGGGRGTFH